MLADSSAPAAGRRHSVGGRPSMTPAEPRSTRSSATTTTGVRPDPALVRSEPKVRKRPGCRGSGRTFPNFPASYVRSG